MSSNLIKTFFQDFSQKEKRVIDTNELVERRIEAIATKMSNPENGGFVSGIAAEALDVSELLTDDAGEIGGDEVSGNVLKTANVDFEEMQEQANEAAQRIIDDARAQAQSIIDEAKETAKREKDQVFADARAQGYEEGKHQAEKENELIRGELDRTRKDLRAEYERNIEELEPRFIETFTGIYEHVFNVDLSLNKDVLLYLIGATMHNVDGRDFLVHVSREDYPAVCEGKGQLVQMLMSPNISMEIVEDATIPENECLIETENGLFDCGLGTQLKELSQKLRLLSYEKC